MELDKVIIGKRLRKQREKLSLSRETFAEMIDISPQFLAELENGKKGMSAETLYKICDKFYLSSDYLLMGRENLSDMKTPVAEMLMNLSDANLSILENILSEFVVIVNSAKKDKLKG